ncbi:MAG: hypothetical protein JXR76_21025, partial [Deltaproteobacteria bacterium]|nr:hypothetical protein [Deltaproteobacteria bacterium]
ATSPATPVAPKKNRFKTPGVVLLASGGGLLVGGLVMGSIAFAKANKLNDDHPEGVPGDEKKNAERLALTADILMGAGIAVATVGAVLLIRGKKEKHTVTATPLITPQMAGIHVGGSF